MATFIELDARDDSQGCNVTVAEIEMPDQSPGNINNFIVSRLVGKTIAQVKGDPTFSWWEDSVTDDTVIVSAFVTYV